MDRRRRARIARLRSRVHIVLDSSVASDATTRIVHNGLIVAVIVSVAAVVLESVPDYASRYGALFTLIEIVAAAIFSLEYGLRVWSAPDQTQYAGMNAWGARWAFMRTASAIVDLLSVGPLYLAFFLPADLRVLLLFRLLRFFKLARYSPGMRSLVAALDAERKALAASGIVLFGLVLITASAMHLVEHDAQPEKFASIPDAMWWSVVTLTTVGYGDVVPITLMGRIVASFTMVMGLMMLALPIGIVATAFAEEIHKREFVVTWGMLARVPLFAALDASEIAEIMHYLRAQKVPAGAMIARRGEAAHAMYFIAAGEVEIDSPERSIILREGQFFGETAILRRTRRRANIRALAPTKLLVLDAADLTLLIERNPSVGAQIQHAAAADAFLQEASPSASSPETHDDDS